MITLISCNSDDDNQEDLEQFLFRENATIVVQDAEDFDIQGDVKITVSQGENLVFRYLDSNGGDASMDGLIVDTIVFEIAPSLTSFSYTEEQFSDIKLFYDQLAFGPSESIPFTEGSVTGTKLDNGNWEVSMSISRTNFENTQTIQEDINAIFIPE
jgi:hypothetical protein